MIASKNGYLKVCELLLSHSAIDINTSENSNGKTALMFSISNTDVEANRYGDYIELIRLFNKHGYTALMYASSNGFIEVVRLLLSHNDIDINISDNNNNNYLFDIF
jgi:ankyrin repeat protein